MYSEFLSKEHLEGDCIGISNSLVGTKLLCGDCVGIIVETEAYLGERDPAAHYTALGTTRDQIIEKGAGAVYIFKIHGHNCLNFIIEIENELGCVLIRAVEPLEGI